ncbi:hypothetical protein Sste5346_002348 [Sporothrix stenoceras]|uniref:Uncharacterized protein n=1 Tax=Sporothrix stenoceras TaxID=5173 RepID=A0ABR3ZIU0_9PEZI
MFFPVGSTPMAVSGRLGDYDSTKNYGNTDAIGSKASSNGGTTFNTGNNHDDFDTNDHHVPIWAWVLVGIGAALVAAFVLSTLFNALHERRLARAENRKPRYARAALAGLKFALFFWVFAAIANGVRSVLGRGKKASATTSYEKIDRNLDNKDRDARSSRSFNGRTYDDSMSYGGGNSDDTINEEPWSSAAYGDGGSGQAGRSGHQYSHSNEKYEPYSSGAAIGTAVTGSGTTAVSVGPAAPYSPNSAFTNTTATSSHVPPPVHITPSVSPMATPLPTPAAVTEPLMSSAAPSATYVPGQDSRPMY